MKSAAEWNLFLSTKFMALTSRLQALMVFSSTAEENRSTQYRQDNLENYRKVEEHAVDILKFLASNLTPETVKQALGEVGFIAVAAEVEKVAKPTEWHKFERLDTRTWVDKKGNLVPHTYKYAVPDRGHVMYFTEYPRLQSSRRGNGELFWLQEGGHSMFGPLLTDSETLETSKCFLQRA